MIHENTSMKKDEIISLMKVAQSAAVKAGKFLHEHITREKTVLLNQDREIKLQLDTDAEELIKDLLVLDNNFPILGEETGLNKDLDDFFWVVDPLDGTSNFLRGIPVSCVSISLMKNLDPILGVIYDFNHDDLFYGSKYTGAYLNSREIKVSNISKKNESTLMTGIPAKTNYSDEEFHSMIDDFQKWKKVRMIGSAAMSSTYVASGKAETYKEDGIFLWDIAAGGAIVSSAGGHITIENLNDDYRVDAKFTNNRVNL